jgi:hypothetical protein
MALLNPPYPLPHAMWAAVRFLYTQRGPAPLGLTQEMLSPATLSPSGSSDDFKLTITALIDLGIVNEVDGGDGTIKLRLGSRLPSGTRDSFRIFAHVLRAAAMSLDRNEGLATSNSQIGPRDLIKALCWFLTLDPLGAPLSVETFENRQKVENPLPEAAGSALVNKTRWNAFFLWCPALGLGQPSLIAPQESARDLVPDATIAIQDAITGAWPAGDVVPVRALVRRVRQMLPVLPGGKLSRSLGLVPPEDHVDSVLSWALLRGQHDGWLELQSQSDSAAPELLADPDRPDGLLRVTSVLVREAHQ